jgi:hypothetical protein
MKKVFISPSGLRDLMIGKEGAEKLIRIHEDGEDAIDYSAITVLEQARDAIEEFWGQLSYDAASGERFIWMEDE